MKFLNLFEIVNDKKVPIEPVDRDEVEMYVATMATMANQYAKELSLWRKGNKTAGRRARTLMYDMIKISPVLNKAMIKVDKGEL